MQSIWFYSGLFALILSIQTISNAGQKYSVDDEVTQTGSIRFVGCPVYRDTDSGRKSGCWLITDVDSGLRLDLQQSFTKPQLGKEVLVEGILPPDHQRADGDCGGVVLEKVRVSVLNTRCPAVILPNEGYAGRRFDLPGTVMTPNHLPQPQPAKPWVTRDFQIDFDFQSDYLRYQHAEVILQEAFRLAILGHAKSIHIKGYADTSGGSVSGRYLRESADLSKHRAFAVQEALVRLGWPIEKISLQSVAKSPFQKNNQDVWNHVNLRRVTLRVEIDDVVRH
jgi:outer membrane protein OmpA-like peptidoglycan-associated protein